MVLTFAVDRHRSVRAFTDVQEAACDDVTGRAAVQEEEVVVVEASVREAFGIVDLLVEADDRRHIVFPEVGEVGLGGVERVTCRGAEPAQVSDLRPDTRRRSSSLYSPFSTLDFG